MSRCCTKYLMMQNTLFGARLSSEARGTGHNRAKKLGDSSRWQFVDRAKIECKAMQVRKGAGVDTGCWVEGANLGDRCKIRTARGSKFPIRDGRAVAAETGSDPRG